MRSHLSKEEVDQLLLEDVGADGGRGGWTSAREHLAECELCQARVREHREFEAKLAMLKSIEPVDRQVDCPPDEVWAESVAGVLEGSRANYLEHASQCGHCGPLLKQVVEDLAYANSTHVEHKAAELASARPEWQDRMAEKMSRAANMGSAAAEGLARAAIVASEKGNPASATSGDPQPERMQLRQPWWNGWWSLPRLGWAAASVAVLVAAGWFGQRAPMGPDVNQLLARAYTEQRTMELRIQGAEYAPLRVTRGPSGSSLDKSEDLLRAEAIIKDNLRKHPDDPKWLQAKGRADLLEYRYEPAIQTLQRALDIKPDDPSLMTDLASAYFQRAEANPERAIDYGMAIEYLGRALAKNPDDPVALFNRAIASEKMHMYHEAVDDWEHYLRVDSNGSWANEGKERVDRIRRQLNQREHSRSSPIHSPEEFLAIVDVSNENTWTEVDKRIEDYLAVATQKWLPVAYSFNNPDAARYRSALTSLALILQRRHRDTWLSDLLESPVTPQMTQAVRLLASSAIQNYSGTPASALTYAQQAQRAFRLARNSPGFVRAEYESLYALPWLAKGSECLKQAKRLERDLMSSSYPWLQAQVMLEAHTCAGMLGDYNYAERIAKEATALAQDSRYPEVEMRAVGFLAEEAALKMDSTQSWQLANEALRRFWEGTYQGDRAEQLYGGLAGVAETGENWFLALALSREALASVSPDESPSFQAMLRYGVAFDADSAGLKDPAGKSIDDMETWFSTLPDDSYTRSNQTFAKVALAKLELLRGHDDKALHWLSTAHADLERFSFHEISLDYYYTLGEVLRRQGHLEESEEALTSAVAILDASSKTLSNEADRTRWMQARVNIYRTLTRAQFATNRDKAFQSWHTYRTGTSDSRSPQPPPPRQSSDAAYRPAGLLTTHDRQFQRQVALVHDLAPRSHETRISYVYFRDGLIVWVYDYGIIYSQWLPIQASRLEELTDRFLRTCRNPRSNKESVASQGSALYRLLIKPIQSFLPPSGTLIIEPDGILNKVVWPALVDEEEQYLGIRHPLMLSEGVSHRSEELRPVTRRDRLLTVVSTVLGDPELQLTSLPQLDYEAKAVSSKFDSAIELSGTRANPDHLRAALRSAEIFHYSGHAIVSAGHAALVLSDANVKTRTALLSAEQLASLRLKNAKLAMLAACDTAASGSTQMADSSTLARAFLQAGFREVVASKWDVDSTATAALSDAFYRDLLNGDSSAISLQHARMLLLTGTKFRHPYYWAPFSVFTT